MVATMPHPLRPIDDGLVYHVINRGNNRQDVFRKRGDFEAFLTFRPRGRPREFND